MEWRMWRWRRSGSTPRISAKKVSGPANKIDLTALTPPAEVLLAHAAAVLMQIAHEYSDVADLATQGTDADELTRAARAVLGQYEEVRELLNDYTENPAALLTAPRRFAKEQFNRFQADAWAERVATCLVVGGFLLDFFRTLSGAMPERLARRLDEVFSNQSAEQLCRGVLARVIEQDASQLSMLSLWSRRVVGDTMLIARFALAPDLNEPVAEERFEPLFSDILTEHTKRLDRLGLTA